MRSIFRMLVLAPVLCASAAFAVERASVDVPFNFESHGKVFPAGKYDVKLDANRSILTLSSRMVPSKTLSWGVGPAETALRDPVLNMKFDQVGDQHELRTVRLGGYQTPVLNAHRKSLLQSELPATGGQ